MKKFIAGFMACATLFTTTRVFAESVVKKIDAVFGQVALVVDNAAVKEETLLYGSRTYVPLRATAEMLGMEASYDAATKTAYIDSVGTGRTFEPVSSTAGPDLVSAEIARHIETQSGFLYLNEVLSVQWQSGKDYGAYTVDAYKVNGDYMLLMNVHKDGSVQEISITNPQAGADTLESFIALVISVLNVDRLGLTDDDRHVVGYAIAGESGIEEEKNFSFTMRNVKERRNYLVEYENMVLDEIGTRNQQFMLKRFD